MDHHGFGRHGANAAIAQEAVDCRNVAQRLDILFHSRLPVMKDFHNTFYYTRPRLWRAFAQYPVGAPGHQPRGEAHQRAHRRAARSHRRLRGARAVRDLLRSHGFKYAHGCGHRCAGSLPRCSSRCPSTWRSVSATKPRLGRIAQGGRERADGERAGIPQRVEQARARGQLAQALSRTRPDDRLPARGLAAAIARVASERAISAWPWYSAWAASSPA